jgi:hypothetical protein
MTTILELLRGCVGLFVDDEFLAVAILAVVAATAFLMLVVGVQPLRAGAVMIIGTVSVLVIGVWRTASRLRSR